MKKSIKNILFVLLTVIALTGFVSKALAKTAASDSTFNTEFTNFTKNTLDVDKKIEEYCTTSSIINDVCKPDHLYGDQYVVKDTKYYFLENYCEKYECRDSNTQNSYRDLCKEKFTEYCSSYNTCPTNYSSDFDTWWESKGITEELEANNGEKCLTKKGLLGLWNTNEISDAACKKTGKLSYLASYFASIGNDNFNNYESNCYITYCQKKYSDVCSPLIALKNASIIACQEDTEKEFLNDFINTYYTSEQICKYVLGDTTSARVELNWKNIDNVCDFFITKECFWGNATCGWPNAEGQDCMRNYCKSHWSYEQAIEKCKNTINEQQEESYKIESSLVESLNAEGISYTGSVSTMSSSGDLSCETLQTILDFFNNAYVTIEIVAFIILTIMSMADFMGVVINSDGTKDADKMKKAQKHLGTRIMIVVIIILLPIIVKLLLGALGKSTCFIGL